MNSRAESRLRLLATSALFASAILVVQAGEAGAVKGKNGVRPLTPKPGAVVPLGGTATFKATVRGGGSVYMNVCTKKKRDRAGRLCKDATITKMKRGRRRGKARVYRVRPPVYTFPGYWLNTARSYYYQVFRIDTPCKRRGRFVDCIHESRLVKFRVG